MKTNRKKAFGNKQPNAFPYKSVLQHFPRQEYCNPFVRFEQVSDAHGK